MRMALLAVLVFFPRGFDCRTVHGEVRPGSSGTSTDGALDRRQVVANCEGRTDSPRWRAMYSAERSNQVPRNSSPLVSAAMEMGPGHSADLLLRIPAGSETACTYATYML